MTSVKKNVLSMLKDRGYKVPESDTDINAFMSAEEYMTHDKNDEENDKVYVFFPKVPKVGVGTVREYIKEMEESDIKHAIIIVKETVTSFVKKNFASMEIEYFTEDQLLINKTEHVLVPKHELISDDEKKELLKKYKCTKGTQLSWILSSDPIARHYGAKKGQVFKITRTSETAGEHITYRIVV